jgi:hypothetical protein
MFSRSRPRTHLLPHESNRSTPPCSQTESAPRPATVGSPRLPSARSLSGILLRCATILLILVGVLASTARANLVISRQIVLRPYPPLVEKGTGCLHRVLATMGTELGRGGSGLLPITDMPRASILHRRLLPLARRLTSWTILPSPQVIKVRRTRPM